MINFFNKRIVLIITSIFYLLTYTINAKALVHIVAAENFYAEVAKEIGGPYINVISMLNNPNQDPHLFTTSPSIAKALSKADIIVYNGADYDPWMQTQLANQKIKYVIIVSELMKIKHGSNPHIWYMPETMPAYAKKLVNDLSQIDPIHRDYFESQLKIFNQSYLPIIEKIKNLKQRFNNVPIIATEPVFNYMSDAIGLKMHGIGFQISMMNDVPPTFSQVKQFEDDLHQHAVKVFIFNNQVINPSTERMLSIAKKENIPVVGISETMPIDFTYVQWIMKELNQLENALEKSRNDYHDSGRK